MPSSLYPFPDPRLLALHLAIAEILNASGMGEETEACLHDDDDISCFAEDGSTNIVEAIERWLVKVNLRRRAFKDLWSW